MTLILVLWLYGFAVVFLHVHFPGCSPAAVVSALNFNRSKLKSLVGNFYLKEAKVTKIKSCPTVTGSSGDAIFHKRPMKTFL